MNDMEKVIASLGNALVQMHGCGRYTPEDVDELETAAWKALELLKKQEAVEPKKENDGNPEPCTSWWYVCGDCGRYIDPHDRFCRHCGREVKWDDI